ncbi:P-loop containing nucleoside triphosphate hydrolase protein [Punctularia strigosozonata HHB-11173 SS5]|uniref:p-loop containing nucleoside triphosphate hydrolase protein n=1 Tax=Punctularia strigosozonata (strain HHB-11173) TaxID=741275 RepID=R7S0A5_PUNST|nr:P-loop containing nucleoside triphosphate hydrolase protein [Punctularia strigosozonata HHB-11173 SS5]EIN03673.1 P-loop containing nucleoside triphosphate hydrolase protein [Punctularia strigosozonata HHB-11173 SS5]
MEDRHHALDTLKCLTVPQRAMLRKGNFKTVPDVLCPPPSDVAKRCRVHISEVNRALDAICTELRRPTHPLQDAFDDAVSGTITTADDALDALLGGGIQTGMMWDVSGESAAGKTQLALQLSLAVQFPPEMGGLSGSSCYITTRSRLPTTRLLEIAQNHPRLDPNICGLADIHTLHTPTPPMLQHVLDVVLPRFVNQISDRSGARPVRLVVIDTLTELFHSETRTTSHWLFERSKIISALSASLHALASQRGLAIVVLNEVTDVFDRDDLPPSREAGADVLYREQSRWFGRANSMPGEDRKQADLGLVWTNQVNARLMLSRTGRRRHLDEDEVRALKRRRLNGDDANSDTEPDDANSLLQDGEPTVIRRLTIVFSAVARPGSVDYVVTRGGISCFRDASSTNAPAPAKAPTFQLASPGALSAPAGTPALQPADVALPPSSSAPRSDPEPNPLGPDTDPFRQTERGEMLPPSDDVPILDSDAALGDADAAPKEDDDEDMYWGDEDGDMEKLYNLIDDASFDVNVIPSSIDAENPWF